MRNKKYQIFVSSTYEDLKEERKAIIENILTMEYLPVGMELFVASDDEQFEYIKKVIDNCDYYVLILGGRYGSVSPRTGISYTEMEYDYAIEKGIPTLVFPHKDIDSLQENLKDKDLTQIKNFYKKASKNRMCSLWSNKEKLISNVIISLNKIIMEKPQLGWIRPYELENLIKENIKLKDKIANYETQLQHQIKDLADLDEAFTIHFKNSHFDSPYEDQIRINWGDIFSFIAPKVTQAIDLVAFNNLINNDLIRKFDTWTCEDYNYIVNEEDIQTIKIQLNALGFIEITEDSSFDTVTEKIKLTPKGHQAFRELRTVKTSKIRF